MIDLAAVAKRALSLMDLTTLNDDDTNDKISQLCQQAKTPIGNAAAVCIYPRFIPLARKLLNAQNTPQIGIATVINFPQGGANIDAVLTEAKAVLADGADEIDVVFPYSALMVGDEKIGFALVSACKDLCTAQGCLLKVILETGQLKNNGLIRHAAEIAIDAGADFLKTSTGKVAINATIESVTILLNAIRDKRVMDRVGLKVAGGVRTTQEATQYLALADQICGPQWADQRHFRFGASGLLANLLMDAGLNPANTTTSDY